MEKKITISDIISKFDRYKYEIIILIIIVIFASIAKAIFNIILDYRIIIIFIGLLWYLGYMNSIQSKLKYHLGFLNNQISNPLKSS
jgi:predicted RND superfamily exporter protein